MDSIYITLAQVGSPIVAAAIAVWQLRSTYLQAERHFKRKQAADYVSRLLSPTLMSVRSQVDEWAHRHKAEDFSPGSLLERTTPEEALALRTLANFFVDLGIAWQKELVDRGYAEEALNRLTCRYWNRMLPFITAERDAARVLSGSKEAADRLYSPFQVLRREFIRTHGDLENET